MYTAGQAAFKTTIGIMKLTDKQIKTQATKKEFRRVFDNFCLPGRDIIASCSDGTYRRKFWQNLNRFGWDKWKKD